jgi:hypothetical protein
MATSNSNDIQIRELSYNTCGYGPPILLFMAQLYGDVLGQSGQMTVFSPRYVETIVSKRLCLRLLISGWQPKANLIENKRYITNGSD